MNCCKVYRQDSTNFHTSCDTSKIPEVGDVADNLGLVIGNDVAVQNEYLRLLRESRELRESRQSRESKRQRRFLLKTDCGNVVALGIIFFEYTAPTELSIPHLKNGCDTISA
jgi:hypothetical protein